MNIKRGYTFKDLLMEPKRSGWSRKDGDTTARFSKNIYLNIPIVSANMDTVTEWKMARFMAEMGGLGVIHRWFSAERQADEVKRVKRAENIVIDDPYSIGPATKVSDALAMMQKQNISGLPVLDSDKKIIGIVTKRDILFCEDKHLPVGKMMTRSVITARSDVSSIKAKQILFKNKIEKLPLTDDNGRLAGLITLKDILRGENYSRAAKDSKGRLLVGAAIGVKTEDTLPRAEALSAAGADVFVVDIAHGHHDYALKTIRYLKKKYPDIDIVGGNIATPSAVRDLIKAGADAVKIGIGPGAACTTRIVTGVGVPQMSAIFQCSAEARKYDVPLIADGGITSSDDLAKALAGGAQTAMIGSLLAGTDESPGKIILENGQVFKEYRGMASREAASDRVKLEGDDREFDGVAEGTTGKVYYKGSARKIIDLLIDGLRNSMSYLGAKDLKEISENVVFWELSAAGMRESLPHDIKF